MTRSIALFDIDNTMYEGFSYVELLEKQVSEKLITQQTLGNALVSMQKYKSKLQDYEMTVVELLDIYAQGLKGASYEKILQSTKSFYGKSEKFFAYVRPTIEELRKTHDLAIVTGEPQHVAEAVAGLFDIDFYYSSEYEVRQGLFTGRVENHLASRHEKHDAISHLMKGHVAKNSFAFGDSEGDIEMLRAVRHPICLNATEGLQAIAKEYGWHVPNNNQVTDLIVELNSTL